MVTVTDHATEILERPFPREACCQIVRDDLAEATVTEEAPLLAHFEGADRFTGLCGKRLIGVRALDTTPDCVVCSALWESYCR